MLKRELGVLLLVGFFVLSSIPAVSCRTAPTIYVAGDGSGDFNCDGTDDHVQINQALKLVAENSAYTTVRLKGPFTYVIDAPLLIGSNTILEGDSDAVIKLVDHAGWDTMVPLIKQMSSSGNTNITIRGFEVDVNHDGNSELAKGKGYYNVIYFLYTSDVKVYDMYMHDGHGDGLRIKYGSNIQFYNNTVYKLGHDGLFAIECSNVEAWNNTITCRTNSALRVWNTNNVKFHDNFIDSFYHWSAGGPGIQVERSKGDMNNIEIYDNVITNTYGPGIWLIGTAGAYDPSLSSVYIHHNIFYGSGTNPSIEWVGGVLGSGFHNVLIENNVFDGVHNAAVVDMYSTDSNAGPSGTGFTTTVRNNIIVNTVPRTKNAAGTGYGVINRLTSSHTIVLENNCLYNNTAGNYKNVNSATDIYVNPLFADSSLHDYHLKSLAGRWNGNTWVKDSTSSQCIDAGSSSSDYSNEPEDNGNKINIGRYGNTIYASLSGIASDDTGSDDTGSDDTGSDDTGSDDTSSDDTTPDEPVSDETIVSEVEVYDNRLREASPSTVYQSSSFIDTGGMNNVRYRDVMGFDLREYTDASQIGAATLSLYWYYPSGTTRPEDTVIEVYRPASSWNSNYVSWTKRDSGVAWKNAGGDWYDKNGVLQGSTPYATITLKGSTLPDNNYYELDVTDLVKEYVSGKYENTGFLIKAKTESNNYIAFYSCDCGNENQEPKLSITKKVASVAVPIATVNTTITGAKDNRLREASPSTVYQSSSFIDVGGISGVGRYRDAMWFDLREYTGSADVSNAILSLYWYYPSGTTRPEDTVIEVYRPASSWNSNYVSWTKRDSGVAWKNAGGDWYDKNGVLQGSTPYATITLKGSTLPDNRYYELDVTDLVKEYTSGEYENTGFLIKARSENNNYIAFYSSGCGNENQVPKLQLVYS
ncbi:disaggregatase related repeat-containing protein [Methanosarcina sp. T3]|uniref:disaggregatase related repeat-containing protein n=1 Tax=Methanosarcina sp. T3 TaxID=3439062 RepID=UPI003F86DA2D